MENTTEKDMLIINSNCWKCKTEMKVAIVVEDLGTKSPSMYGPHTFSASEIQLAQDYGAIIQEHYSATRDEKYFANTCPNCQTFVGEHYLFIDYFCEAVQYEALEFQKIPIK